MPLRCMVLPYLTPAPNCLQSNKGGLTAESEMVPLPNYLPMLDDNVCIRGIIPIIRDSHFKTGLTCKAASKLLEMSESHYKANLTNKKSCSLKFLRRFRDKIDSEIFDKVYTMPALFFTERAKTIFLPKLLESELAYFVGYLQGDGCLTYDQRQVYFSDEYISQIKQMNHLSKKLFGVEGHIFWSTSELSTKPSPHLEIKNVVLNSFIHHVFGVNRGEKCNLKIPEIIKSEKPLLASYLAGLFDSDGTLPKEPSKVKQLFIDVTLKDLCIIQEIKQCLLLFGIETLKIYVRKKKSPSSDVISSTHELRIRRKGMLKKFLHEIGFRHPNKAIRAQKMLELLKRARWDLNPRPSP